MSIWLTNKPDILISDWRELRKRLEDPSLSEIEILELVEKHFAMMPRGSRSIDYYTPKNWQSPWEIIHHKLYCNNAVTLMQYYTLTLCPGIDVSKIQIYLIEDDQDEYVVLVYDNKYLLNYYYGEVLDFSKHRHLFKINQTIHKNEIPKIS